MVEEMDKLTVIRIIGASICCKCGATIQPNAVNTCAKCLSGQVDITQGLQKNVTICRCPECHSYLQPPSTWIKARFESKELMAFCLSWLTNLNEVRLVQIEFLWTGHLHKPIRLQLKVQKEVQGDILTQDHIVEYFVRDQMCEVCSRVQANA